MRVAVAAFVTGVSAGAFVVLCIAGDFKGAAHMLCAYVTLWHLAFCVEKG